MVRPILRYSCDRCGTRWTGQTDDCPHCAMVFESAEVSVAKMSQIIRKVASSIQAAAAPIYPPGPGEDALVAAPRSLPSRWRRVPAPAIMGLTAGAVSAWLIPPAVGAVLIVALIVAVSAIHKYVPDALPAARIRR